jgi:hypothetical protein
MTQCQLVDTSYEQLGGTCYPHLQRILHFVLRFRSPVLNLTTVESHKSYIHCYVSGDSNGSTQEMFVKGKAIPLQACTGPEGSRRLRLPDFKTIGT